MKRRTVLRAAVAGATTLAFPITALAARKPKRPVTGRPPTPPKTKGLVRIYSPALPLDLLSERAAFRGRHSEEVLGPRVVQIHRYRESWAARGDVVILEDCVWCTPDYDPWGRDYFRHPETDKLRLPALSLGQPIHLDEQGRVAYYSGLGVGDPIGEDYGWSSTSDDVIEALRTARATPEWNGPDHIVWIEHQRVLKQQQQSS